MSISGSSIRRACTRTDVTRRRPSRRSTTRGEPPGLRPQASVQTPTRGQRCAQAGNPKNQLPSLNQATPTHAQPSPAGGGAGRHQSSPVSVRARRCWIAAAHAFRASGSSAAAAATSPCFPHCSMRSRSPARCTAWIVPADDLKACAERSTAWGSSRRRRARGRASSTARPGGTRLDCSPPPIDAADRIRRGRLRRRRGAGLGGGALPRRRRGLAAGSRRGYRFDELV